MLRLARLVLELDLEASGMPPSEQARVGVELGSSRLYRDDPDWWCCREESRGLESREREDDVTSRKQLDHGVAPMDDRAVRKTASH
jgi:hypothetical protein